MRGSGLSSTNANGSEVDWVVDVVFILLILTVGLVIYSTSSPPDAKIVKAATSAIRVARTYM